MSTNRREFLEQIGTTAMLGALPLSAMNGMIPLATQAAPRAEEWDMSWVNAVKGKKHKAVFDATEIESGFGVFRARVWEQQYQSALGAKASDIVTVLVLRHNALVLALQQNAWDQFAIGPSEKVTHPITQQATPRNPALLTVSDGVPAAWDYFALPRFIAAGGVALACNLALQHFAGGYAQKAGITQPEAAKRMAEALVPGVKLMPSGVFACVRAGEEGCVYVKAS